MPSSKERNYFDNLNIHEGLKNRSVSGGIIVVGSQVCKFILKFGSTIVLARLITPQDFGLIAMVAAITNFVSMFKDMGLSMATVQRSEISHAQVSTLFWINLAISAGLTVLTVAIAPLVSSFYGDPRLTWVTIGIAFGFIISGVSVQHQALLVRQMRYGSLAIVEIISMVIGIATGIWAAWVGMSYWALVIMQLSTVFVMSLGFWIACAWRPGMPVRSSGVQSMLHYGGNLTGFNVLNYFSRNLDNVLIGKYWGAQQLGLYDRAYQLMLFPITQVITPISSVAIPVLSRLQNDPERYEKYYFSALNFIAYIICPVMIVVVVMSDEVVLLLLGTNWVGASLIFKALALVAIVQPLLATLGWVYQSLGRTNRMMRWGFISVPIYIISFIIGLQWGGNGVAIAYTVCCYILLLPSILYAFQGTSLKISDFFQSIICPVIIAISIYPIVAIYRSSMYGLSPSMYLLGSFTILLIVLLIYFLIWPRVRGEITNLYNTFNKYSHKLH